MTSPFGNKPSVRSARIRVYLLSRNSQCSVKVVTGSEGGSHDQQQFLGDRRRVRLDELPQAGGRLGPGEGPVQVAQGRRGLLARGLGREPPQGRRSLLDRRGAAARARRLTAAEGQVAGNLNKLEEEPKDGAVSAGSNRRGPPTSFLWLCRCAYNPLKMNGVCG